MEISIEGLNMEMYQPESQYLAKKFLTTLHRYSGEAIPLGVVAKLYEKWGYNNCIPVQRYALRQALSDLGLLAEIDGTTFLNGYSADLQDTIANIEALKSMQEE